MDHSKFLVHKVTPYKIRLHLNVHQKRLGKPSKDRFYFLSPDKVTDLGNEMREDLMIKQDSWFLGVLSYLMLTLTYPFDSIDDIYHKRPELMKENISQDMKDLIIIKLLNKDPAQRPSIEDLLQQPLIKEAVIKFIGELSVDD